MLFEGITTFETEGFTFGSTNPEKVKHVKKLFENGLTVDDIKNNNMINRHALMINLACWGNCSLTKDYDQARETRRALYDDLINSLPKYHSNRVLWRDAGWNMIADELYRITGWRF